MMSNAEKFAASLVALALVRNGYETIKEIPGNSSHSPAILVAGSAAGKTNAEETFAVVIKVIHGQDAIPVRLDDLRTQHRSPFASTVYFAFFIDREGRLVVEEALCQRMRFRDEEIQLEALRPITQSITSA